MVIDSSFQWLIEHEFPMNDLQGRASLPRRGFDLIAANWRSCPEAAAWARPRRRFDAEAAAP
jgi:hypothetical protein